MNSKYHTSNLSFIDFLLTFSLTITVFFIIALASITESKKQNDMPAKADMMIVAEWPNDFNDDIDLWVKTPTGQSINYKNRNADLVFLDRDDRGDVTNKITLPDGTERTMDSHKEVITFRGLMPGRYLVSLQAFVKRSNKGPTKIKVAIIDMNPAYQEVLSKTIEMQNTRDEVPVASLIIDDQLKLSYVDPDGEPFVMLEYAK